MSAPGTLYLGIDPGLTGALAWVRVSPDGNPAVAHVADMPVAAKSHGKGNAVMARALADLIRAKPPTLAIVERVQAMPPRGRDGRRAAGAQSSFVFGYGAGVVEGVLAALGVSVAFVLPASWKRAVGLSGKPKDAARILAAQRFPEAAPWLLRKKDTGRADAILMAVYGPGLWDARPIETMLE
jgi:hypothetical protein